MTEEILDKSLGEEEKPKYVVNDLKSADWALKKIAEIQSEMAVNDAYASKEKELIDNWLESENKRHNSSIEYFQSLLGGYLIELRKNNPKAKVSTPHGTVSTRKQAKQWTYSDDVLNELEEKGMTDFIRIKKEVDKKELKKALSVSENNQVTTADGEIISGISVIDGGENVVIKVID